MTIYVYKCLKCEANRELNVPMADRDNQKCEECKAKMERVVSFTGAVWSPTANGGMKR